MTRRTPPASTSRTALTRLALTSQATAQTSRPIFEVADRFKVKIHREGATMEEFVGVLTPLQSPVLNQTGLTKRYDFNPGDPPPD